MSVKPITIYLSSTFADMTAYRAAIAKILLNDAYGDVVKLRYAETAISEDVSVWERVEADVLRCDHYFLLMGERYGSMSMNSEVNEDGISFTEHEFNVALANNKSIRIFWGTDPLLLNYVDTLETGAPDVKKQEKLKLFKARVNALERYTKPFATESELTELLQSTIFSLVIKRFPPGTETYAHMFCNRLYQTTVVKSKRFDGGGFQAFIVRGENADLGNELIKRFCLRELYVGDHSLPTEELVLTAKTNEENTKTLLNSYTEKILGPGFLKNSIAEIFTVLDKNTEKKTITMSLEVDENTIGPQDVAFLKSFIKTCADNANGKIGKSIYFFLNVTEVVAKKTGMTFFQKLIGGRTSPGGVFNIDEFTAGLPYCHDTSKLGKVSRTEIVKWIVNEMDKDPVEADTEFDANFKQFDQGTYSMRDVYPSLKEYSKKNQQQ
jgi:hypothetical protein